MKKFCLIIFLLVPFLFSCGGSGSNKSIFLDGEILNFGEFGIIEVEVIEDDRTRDSDDVDENGDFNLNFNADSGLVTLRFIGEEITVERSNFSVTDDSTIVLDVTIQQNPIAIIFNSWVVFQDRLSLRGDDEVVLQDTEAEIVINGDGNHCIHTRDDSIVDFRVKSIDISNCDEGVRTENSSQVILLADDSIAIFSDSNGVRSKDESFVSIGQVLNASNNSVEVRSFEADGVNTSGTATVIFTPQNNNCTIRGANSGVNEGSNSNVETDGCSIVDG